MKKKIYHKSSNRHNKKKSLGSLLVRSRYTLHGNDKVLERTLLGLLLDALAVHDTVKGNRILHQVVQTTTDAEDAKGKDPHTDNRDNRRLTADKPAKDTEQSGNDIDNEDRARQLPRWN